MTSDRGSTGATAELQQTIAPVTGKPTLNPNADVFQLKNAAAAAPLVDNAAGGSLVKVSQEDAGLPLANGDVIAGVEEDGGVDALLAYQENGPAPAPVPLPLAAMPDTSPVPLPLPILPDPSPEEVPHPAMPNPGPEEVPLPSLPSMPSLPNPAPEELEVVSPPVAALVQEAAPSAAVEEMVDGAVAGAVCLGAEASPIPSAEALPENGVDRNELRAKIGCQIDYYFSQENLEKDDYMWSQMDTEHWLPIATIAAFKKMQLLTSDIELVKEVLIENKSVQVDEKVERVRPVACSRCIIMLREIQDTVAEAQVRSLFNSSKCPAVVSVKRDINDTWFITFSNETDCSRAYQYLMSEVRTFLDKPIRARIKSKVLNRNPGGYQRNGYNSHRMQPTESTVYSPNFQQAMPTVTPRMPPFLNNQPDIIYDAHQRMMFRRESQAETHHELEESNGHAESTLRAEAPEFVPGEPYLGLFQAALYGNLTSQLITPWPQATAAPTPQPTYLDPGQMLNLNGYQATAIRGSSGNRHVPNYSGNARNSRNANRQHRGGGQQERSTSESRMTGDRGPPMPGSGGSRTSPRSLDGAPITTPQTSMGHSFQSRGQRGSDLPHSVPLHPPQLTSHSGSGGGDSMPRGGNTGDSSGGSQRRSYGRRNRRDGEGSRNTQRQQTQSARESRMEQQFELESNSFPPLPGSGSNSGSSEVFENSRVSHSDIVRGTGRPQQPRSSASSEPRPSAMPTASPTVSATPIPPTPLMAAQPPPLPPREAPEPTAVPVSHPTAPVSAEPAHQKSKANHHHMETKSVAEPSPAPASPATAAAAAVATVSAQHIQSKPVPEPAKISYAQMLKRNNAASQNAPAQDTPASPNPATSNAPSKTGAEESPATVSAAGVVNSGRPTPRDHLQNQRITSPAGHRGGMNGTRREDGREPRYGGRGFRDGRDSGPRSARGGRRSQTK